MKKRIAVESELSNVSEYLSNHGYDVLEFQHNQAVGDALENVDAVVITGMDENMLGMHDIMTTAPVIEVSGMTPAQVEKQLSVNLELQ